MWGGRRQKVIPLGGSCEKIAAPAVKKRDEQPSTPVAPLQNLQTTSFKRKRSQHGSSGEVEVPRSPNDLNLSEMHIASPKVVDVPSVTPGTKPKGWKWGFGRKSDSSPSAEKVALPSHCTAVVITTSEASHTVDDKACSDRDCDGSRGSEDDKQVSGSSASGRSRRKKKQSVAPEICNPPMDRDHVSSWLHLTGRKKVYSVSPGEVAGVKGGCQLPSTLNASDTAAVPVGHEEEEEKQGEKVQVVKEEEEQEKAHQGSPEEKAHQGSPDERLDKDGVDRKRQDTSADAPTDEMPAKKKGFASSVRKAVRRQLGIKLSKEKLAIEDAKQRLALGDAKQRLALEDAAGLH